ncbi:hypothetical protein JKP88DRAFT_219300 [Tribonema minus]|uniref:Mediator of RNA polymerase II transcription subunit 21 n=1 Tax=Tribonema minus TaxID=303371 RepID=A0A835Z332_9STRA|nr:hypothetical protein JKP88DRAFT_219300 [Tribonema minus]
MEFQGAGGDQAPRPISPYPQDQDQVSVMQDKVDQLALAMFESIRSLPDPAADPSFAPEFVVSAGQSDAQQQHGQQWIDAVAALSARVVAEARALDNMIETLPGMDKTEAQQLQELKELGEESAALALQLRGRTAEAAAAADAADKVLDHLSSTLLVAPQNT